MEFILLMDTKHPITGINKCTSTALT